ncbi:MAG: DUF1552 domain-containing protein, partial [Myxococcota bacterium]
EVGVHAELIFAGEPRLDSLDGSPSKVEHTLSFDELLPLAGNQDPQEDTGRQSVLDFARGTVQRIQPRLAREDQLRMDTHLDAVRDLERRLEASAGASCDLNLDLDRPNLTREDVAQDIYIELTKLALTCDATRVVGAMFGSHTSNLTYRHLGAPPNARNWHNATHNGGNDAWIRSVLRFRAEQFTKLIQTLDSVTEASGKTLLDNTVVLWFTDVPRGHSDKDVFTMIAGGTHYFNHGQTIEANGAHNKALTSIARAMGFDVDTFGDPGYGRGELPAAALR